MGIDKTVIKNFTVKSVDMDKLLSKGNMDNGVCLRGEKNRYNYFAEQREDNFNLIKISDNTLFNSLKIDVKKVGQQFIQYGVLDLSIKQEGQNNLVPLTVGAYKQKVKAIFKYIRERYGIVCDTSNIKFENIELNVTAQLDGEFESYLRAMKVLMLVAPKSYRNRIIIINHQENKTNQLEISNKSIKCKFYDKSEQLKEVYDFDTNKNILRVEYTLLNAEKMKDIFGHNELDKLTDDDIKQFVKSQFEKDFVKRYEGFKAKNKAELIKIAKEYRDKHRQWIREFLKYLVNEEVEHEIFLLIDVKDLEEVIKKVDKSHFSRNWKQIKQNCLPAYKGVDMKVKEIFKKITNVEQMHQVSTTNDIKN